MAENITAKLKQHRQSPRKVRLVADLIRGKDVERALIELNLIEKRSALPIAKLLKSAIAGAREQKVDLQNLFIKKLSVDEGTILYRRRFRARGKTAPIRKRTSHISLVLGEKPVKKIKQKKLTNNKKSKPVAEDQLSNTK